MKCPKCSYENPEGAQYCNLCYNALVKKVEMQKPVPENNTVRELKNNKENYSERPAGCFTFSIIVVLLIITTIILGFNMDKNSLTLTIIPLFGITAYKILSLSNTKSKIKTAAFIGLLSGWINTPIAYLVIMITSTHPSILSLTTMFVCFSVLGPILGIFHAVTVSQLNTSKWKYFVLLFVFGAISIIMWLLSWCIIWMPSNPMI